MKNLCKLITLSLLFVFGANMINAASGYEEKCQFFEAISNGNLVEVQRFIASGFNLYSVIDPYGSRHTALHLAAQHGYVHVVKELLSAVSSDEVVRYLNILDCIGSTALHRAAEYGHEAVVNQLIEQLAAVDPDGVVDYLQIKDGCGCTALHLAAIRINSGGILSHEGHEAVVDALITTVEKYAKSKNDMVVYLSIQNNRKRTALHLAAPYGLPHIVDRLIAAAINAVGEDHVVDYLNIQDDIGWTALHWAVKNRDCVSVVALIRAGADPYIRTRGSSTAYDIAAIKWSPDFLLSMTTAYEERPRWIHLGGVYDPL